MHPTCSSIIIWLKLTMKNSLRKVFYDMLFLQRVGRHCIGSIRLAELRGCSTKLGGQLCVLNVKLFCIESSLRYEQDVTTYYGNDI